MRYPNTSSAPSSSVLGEIRERSIASCVRSRTLAQNILCLLHATNAGQIIGTEMVSERININIATGVFAEPVSV